MNFKQATDALLGAVTLQDLAEAMGVSVQALRQARSAEGTAAHRSPPEGWELAIQQVANRRASHLQKLAAKLND